MIPLFTFSTAAFSSPANGPATETPTTVVAPPQPVFDLTSCPGLQSAAERELELSLTQFVKLINEMKKSGGVVYLSEVQNVRLGDYYEYLAPLKTYVAPTSVSKEYETTEFHWNSSNWFESENQTVGAWRKVYTTPDSSLSPLRADQRVLAMIADVNDHSYNGSCLSADQSAIIQNFIAAQFNPYSTVDKH